MEAGSKVCGKDRKGFRITIVCGECDGETVVQQEGARDEDGGRGVVMASSNRTELILGGCRMTEDGDWCRIAADRRATGRNHTITRTPLDWKTETSGVPPQGEALLVSTARHRETRLMG